MAARKQHWWQWPCGYVPGVSYIAGPGRGRRLRAVLEVTVPVEFQLRWDAVHERWLVKMKRTRGPHQWLPFNAVSRPVRERLLQAIKGHALPASPKVVHIQARRRK
jgi:hypothetical protein